MFARKNIFARPRCLRKTNSRAGPEFKGGRGGRCMKLCTTAGAAKNTKKTLRGIKNTRFRESLYEAGGRGHPGAI